jgi:hypothetical protein
MRAWTWEWALFIPAVTWAYLVASAWHSRHMGWDGTGHGEDRKPDALFGLLWPFTLPWTLTTKILNSREKKDKLAKAEVYRKNR